MSEPSTSPQQHSVRYVHFRRSPWFGVSITLCVLLGMPLLLYIALQIYIIAGGLKSSLESRLRKNFGPAASIAEITADGLHSIGMRSIRLPGQNSSTELLKLDALELDFKLWNLVSQGELERIELLRPQVEIRQEDGQWNFPRSAEPRAKFTARTLLVRDGSFRFAMGNRQLDLNNIHIQSASLSPPLGHPFQFKGNWPSGGSLHGFLLVEPDGSIEGSISSSLDLMQDLNSFISADLAGSVMADLSLNKSATAQNNDNTVLQCGFRSRLKIEKLRYALPQTDPFAFEQALVVSLEGSYAKSSDRTERIVDGSFSLERLGQLRAREISMQREGSAIESLQFEDGSAQLQLDFLFSQLPQRLRSHERIQGQLAITALNGTWSRNNGNSALQLRTALEGSQLKYDSTAGKLLPVLNFISSLELDTQGTSHLSLSAQLGTWGSIKALLSAKVVNSFALPTDLKCSVDRLDIALERIFRAPSLLPILRILTGRTPEGNPLYKYWDLTGSLEGEKLEVETTVVSQDVTRLRLADLKLRNLSILNWPITLTPLEDLLTGQLSVDVTLRGFKPSAFSLDLSLNDKNSSRLHGQLIFDWVLQQEQLQLTRIAIPNLCIPIDKLLRLLGMPSMTAFKTAGDLTLSDGIYDRASETFTCKVQLSPAYLQAPLKLATIEDFALNGDISLSKGDLRCSFQTGSFSTIFVTGLMQQSRFTVPAGNLRLELNRSGPSLPVWSLRWEAEDGTACGIKGVLQTVRNKAYTVDGQFEALLPQPLSGHFSLPVDLDRLSIGPGQFRADTLELQTLRRLFTDLKLPDQMQGQLEEVVVDFAENAILDLLPKLRNLQARIQSKFSRLGFPPNYYDLSIENASGRGVVQLQQRREGNWTTDALLQVDEGNLTRNGGSLDLSVHPLEVKAVFSLMPGSLDTGIGLDKFNLSWGSLCRLEAKGTLNWANQPAGALRRGVIDWKCWIPELNKPSPILQPLTGITFPELAGQLFVSGSHLWDERFFAGNGLARAKTVQLEHASAQLRIVSADGDLPFSYTNGFWPLAWAERRTAKLKFEEVRMGMATLNSGAITLTALPNEFRVLPDGPFLLKDRKLPIVELELKHWFMPQRRAIAYLGTERQPRDIYKLFWEGQLADEAK